MTASHRILNIMSAGLFVAGTAMAATTTPVVNPSFAQYTLCHETPDKHEFCCEGHLVGLGDEVVTLRLDTAYQCLATDTEDAVHISAKNSGLKPVKGELVFDGTALCTTPPTAKECPARFVYAPGAQIVVEQGDLVIHGTAVVFP